MCLVVPPQRVALRVGDSPAPAVARAIPEMVTLDGQVWLKAEGLPAGELVSLTLLAPDGTSCGVPSDQLEGFPSAPGEPAIVEAFVNPADCASVEGVWTATFSAAGVEATARFLAVQVPYRSVPAASGSACRASPPP